LLGQQEPCLRDGRCLRYNAIPACSAHSPAQSSASVAPFRRPCPPNRLRTGPTTCAPRIAGSTEGGPRPAKAPATPPGPFHFVMRCGHRIALDPGSLPVYTPAGGPEGSESTTKKCRVAPSVAGGAFPAKEKRHETERTPGQSRCSEEVQARRAR